MIRYDGTVRSSNDRMIQVVYGDSGVDTTKQYEYLIKMIEMSNDDIKDKFVFTKDELKSIKGATEKDNNKLYDTVIELRNILRECVMKSTLNYIALKDKFMLPVNINRIVDTVMGTTPKDTEQLTPKYIIDEIELLLSNARTTLIYMSTKERNNAKSFKRRDEELHKIVFRAALYDSLNPKRMLVELKVNKPQFDQIILEMAQNFNKNMIEPGEMAGIVAAQSTGEPLTQMSCVASAKIIIKNKKTNFTSYTTMGEFIDSLLENNKSNVLDIPKHKDSVALDINDYEIISVDTDGKTHWKTISQVTKHPANGDLIKIKTKTGRVTTTTKSHSHLKRTVDSIVPIEGSKLKVGDRIPITKKIPAITNPMKKMQIGENTISLDHNFGWLCGAYLADGRVDNNVIGISKVIPEYKEKVKEIVDELFDAHVYTHDSVGEYGDTSTMSFSDKHMADFLIENFGVGSFNKKIGGFVFGTNLGFISGIISGYFDGDGNMQCDDKNHISIRASSRSKDLVEGLSILCSYFGIFGSLLEERSVKQPNKVQYNFSIQRKYAKLFSENIDLTVVEKKNILLRIIDKLNNNNTQQDYNDTIPELGTTIGNIGKILKVDGWSRTYGKYERGNAIGNTSLSKIINEFENLFEDQKDDISENNNKAFKTNMTILKKAVKSDVVWDNIILIDVIKNSKEYVYDFTVPGTETFMVDAGVLVHNTLNSFHHSGIASMSATVQGVPRMKELLSVSKKPKTPQMVIYLTQEYLASKDMAHKIGSHIKHTTLGDIRGRVNVYYDPNPKGKDGIMEKDNVKHTFFQHKGSKTGCQSEITGLPWLMRIELDREKMLDKEVTLLEIKTKFCSWWEKRFAEAKSMRKEEKKVLNKITQIAVLSNSDNDKQPVVHLRFNVKDADKDKDKFDTNTIDNFIDFIIDKFKLKGIANISDIPAIQEERILTFDKDSGKLERNAQYVIYATGVNFNDVRYLTGIDLNKTISNHVMEVYNTFGIEIARAVLLREVSNAYERAGGEVNYQHVSMIVDQMTATGTINSIDRHGMNKSDSDPLSRASFEKTVEQLLIASVYGETDHMKGVSSRVMVGAVIKGGTGYCELELDTEMIEKSEYIENIDYTKKFTELNKGTLAVDIINKKNDDIFVPS